MKYMISINPTSLGNFEIMLTNGVERKTVNISSLSTSGWCLCSDIGNPLKFYSRIEELLYDFEQKLNEEFIKENQEN